MSQWGWVILGWSLVVVVLGVYALTVLRRGARLTPRVAAERRRWISTPAAEETP